MSAPVLPLPDPAAVQQTALRRRGRGAWITALLLAPPLLWLGVVYLGSLLGLLLYGFYSSDSGSIKVLGTDLHELADEQAIALRRRWGVMFQHGGLFGSLTVHENVGLPLREHTALADALIDDIAAWKLDMTGLAPEVGAQYPSELSGGMMKRASLARALALDPELLFLDEPTAGLDPVSAAGVDQLVLKLRDQFGLTIVMITHDLDLLWQVADRVAVLADGRVQGVGSMPELAQMDHPAIRPYFDGPRGRAAQDHGTQATPQAGSESTGRASSKPK